MQVKKRFLPTILTMVFALTLAISVFSVQPAFAAVDGQNPQTTGCSADATTSSTFNMTNPSNGQVIGTVELRHSNACGAFWARVNSNIGGTLRGSITRISSGARQTLVSGAAYTFLLAGGTAGNYSVCGTVNQGGTCGMP